MYEEKAQTKHSSINCRRKIAYIDDLFTHTSPIHRTSGKSNFQLSFIAAFSKILFSILSLCASICLDFGCCCCIQCTECTLVLTHFIFNFTIIRYRKINSWANKSHETQNLNCSLKRSCSLYACKAKQSKAVNNIRSIYIDRVNSIPRRKINEYKYINELQSLRTLETESMSKHFMNVLQIIIFKCQHFQQPAARLTFFYSFCFRYRLSKAIIFRDDIISFAWPYRCNQREIRVE